MMQVQNIRNTSASDLQTLQDSGEQIRPEGVQSFEAQLGRALLGQPAAPTPDSGKIRFEPATGSRIELGTLSSDQPTVSHLLVNNPNLQTQCWEIVHADINTDKPYTRIPEGTKISIDPQSLEIVWKTDEPATRTDTPTLSSSSELPAFHNKQEQRTVEDRSCIEQSISMASAKYGLSQDLIRGVVRAESDFQPNAISSAGAQGLMQLMPATARELGVKNPFDIMENIDAGTRYLKKMLTLFNGDIKQALAAYNAGPQTIKASQGEIPYHETRHYVQRVLSFSGLQA